MSAELAHFKCERCSAVGHQTSDCILGYAQLWQSTVRVVLGYHNCGILPIRGVLGYLHCGIVQALASLSVPVAKVGN